jgi:hypothetical protein
MPGPFHISIECQKVMSISSKDNTLRSARNVGRLSGSKRINGLLGLKDKIDFAKFTLSEVSEFELTLGRVAGRASASVTLRNNRGSVLQSFKGGASAKAFKSTLAEGTYYIGIQRLRGEVNYKIVAEATKAGTGGAIPNPPGVVPTPPGTTPTPPNPGTSLSTANDIGILSGTYTNRGFVGTTDPVDLYKFTLNDSANLQARVDSSSASTKVELIRDINNNGLIDNGEVLVSDTDFSAPHLSSVTEDLPPGTYALRITSGSSSASTQYQLNLVATLFGGNISPEPGNTLPVARDLGAFSGTFSAKEYVGKIDSNDFYKFTLNDISNLQISAKSSSATTEIKLIRDSNNNGLVDNGEILASDTDFSSPFLSSVTQDLPAGTYFVGVEPRGTTSSTLYELNLVAAPFGGNISPDPGNTVPTARNLGALSGTFSAKEHVGILDSDDFYKFTLNNADNLQARVTGSSANTRIQLIQDINNNGLIDNGETIASDSNFSSTFLSQITRDVQAGTYLIRVNTVNSNASTNYSLSLTV